MAALEHLIRLFCLGYNNVYDNALAWLEPTEKYLEKAIDTLQDKNIDIDDKQFIEIFNAWLMDIFNKYGALGHQIDDECRRAVLSSYKRLGLPQNWDGGQERMEKNTRKDRKGWMIGCFWALLIVPNLVWPAVSPLMKEEKYGKPGAGPVPGT